MKLFVLCCLVATALAVPAQDGTRTARNSIQTESNLLDSVYQDCLKKDTVSCVKYKVFSVVDKVLGQSDITVTDGVQIVKTSEPTGAPRALTENDGIESVIFNKVATFLDTHTLKVNLNGKEIMDTAAATARSISESFAEEDEDEEEEDSLDEGRGKGGKKKIKKIKKIFGPIFGIIALKAGFLIKLAIIGLALMAGKALIVSKLALVLAGIMAIKKLFGSKLGGLGNLGGLGGSSHEVHGGGYGGDIGGGYGGGYAASSGHGGWGRSTDIKQLAYKGYAQAQETQS